MSNDQQPNKPRKPSLRNRIKSYTRWPDNRHARIAEAKTEIAAALFFQRLGLELPDDISRRSNGAFDRLQADQVPMSQWE